MKIEDFLKKYDIQGTDKIPADVVVKLMEEYMEQDRYITVYDSNYLHVVKVYGDNGRVLKSWNTISCDASATECNELLNKLKNDAL